MPIRVEAQPLLPQPQPLSAASKYKSETSVFINQPERPSGRVEYTVTISPQRRPFTPQPSDFRSTTTRKTTTQYRSYTPQPADFSRRVLTTSRRGEIVTGQDGLRSQSTNLFETMPRLSTTSQDILRSSSVAADRTDNFRNWYHYKMEDDRQRKGSLNLVPPPTGRPKLSPVYYDNAPRSNTPRTLYTDGGMMMQPIRTTTIDQPKVPRPVPVKSYETNMFSKYSKTSEQFENRPPPVDHYRDRLRLQPIGVHTISSRPAPQDEIEDEYKLQAIGIQNLDSGRSQPTTPVFRDDLRTVRTASQSSGSSTLPREMAIPPQAVEIDEEVALHPIGAGLYPLESTPKSTRPNSVQSLPRPTHIRSHYTRKSSSRHQEQSSRDAVDSGILDALDLSTPSPVTNRDPFASPPARSASVPPQMMTDQQMQMHNAHQYQQQRAGYFEQKQRPQFQQQRVMYPTGSLRHQSATTANAGLLTPQPMRPSMQQQTQYHQQSSRVTSQHGGQQSMGQEMAYTGAAGNQSQQQMAGYSQMNGNITQPRAFDFTTISQDGPTSQQMSFSHHKAMQMSETRAGDGQVHRQQPQYNESLQKELHVDTAAGGGIHESSFQQIEYPNSPTSAGVGETPGFPLTNSPMAGQSAFTISSSAATQQVSQKFVKDLSKFWYRPKITRDEAINMLKNRPPGSFVVRDSTSYAGSFGLALKVAQLPPNMQRKSSSKSDFVRHFLVETTTNGVRLKGCPNEPVFSSLASLIYQHTVTALALPCKLVLPEVDGEDMETIHVQASNANEFIVKGAACNVLYINSVDTESLTGPQAIAKALYETQKLKPDVTVCHFKVGSDGITLTDLNRKLFFRRHFAAESVTFCGLDPEDRRWSTKDEHVDVSQARLFGFVARKANSRVADNICHIFAELDPEQPATAIVNFISKFLIGTTVDSV